MEEGDLAVHGHEVYPVGRPSLGVPAGVAGGAPAALRRQSRRGARAVGALVGARPGVLSR